MSPRRRQKKIFWQHEIQQGLCTRPAAPWVVIPGVYKAVYIACTSSRLLNQPSFGYCQFFVLFYEHSILEYIVKSRRKGFELEPWSLPRFPARTFSLQDFFQVFSGSRLTAFVPVVSGSSALLVFSISVSLTLCTCTVITVVHLFLHWLNIFMMDVYEINHWFLMHLASIYAYVSYPWTNWPTCLVGYSSERFSVFSLCSASVVLQCTLSQLLVDPSFN